MAYVRPLVRLTFSGSVAGEDIWSNGLSIVAIPNGNLPAYLNSIDMVALADAAQTFYCGPSGEGMNAYNTLDSVKAALIGTDGKYIADPVIYDFTTPVAGVGSFSTSPQDTVVVSLLTGAKRGLAKRGRIYVPSGFAEPLPDDGRLTTGAINAIGLKAANFINAVNDATDAGGNQGVVGVASNQREGMERVVTQVSVGNLMDNQNRRRNRLTEEYVSYNVQF